MPDTTRLAPSPTGALHLGNARTFLITWAHARRSLWKIVYRIEDLDTPRIKPGAAAELTQTLAWLGLDWDTPEPLIQSADLSPYRAAIRILASRGLAYPCSLSRTDIENSLSAPQAGAHETPFPAALRPPIAGTPLDFDSFASQELNWRFVTPPGPVHFVDAFAGAQVLDASESVGDFVLWTKRGLPSYQLAVVVDDHRQHITNVIRGDDLLDSAARQLQLWRALQLQPEPAFMHLPLVLGQDGRRLAKRHGDTRVDHYRSRGVPPEAIVGLIAFWSGILPRRERLAATEFRNELVLSKIPAHPITFTDEDDRWLLSQAR